MGHDDDPLARWLEAAGAQEEDMGGAPADGPQRPGVARAPRRWGLLAAAIAPWIVVAALGVTAVAGPQASQPPRLAGPASRQASAPPPAQTPAGASTTEAPAGLPTAPSDGQGPVDERLAAAAVLAVRATVPAAQPQRWVEQAVAEDMTVLGSLAVVTVAAVVLEREGEAWTSPQLTRFAVPLLRGAGTPARAAGPPWSLPASRAPELVWEPFIEPALTDAASAALSAGGYVEPSELTLARSQALPGVLQAKFTARAPDETGRRPHEVWLRDDPHPVVLGQHV